MALLCFLHPARAWAPWSSLPSAAEVVPRNLFSPAVPESGPVSLAQLEWKESVLEDSNFVNMVWGEAWLRMKDNSAPSPGASVCLRTTLPLPLEPVCVSRKTPSALWPAGGATSEGSRDNYFSVHHLAG